MHPFLPLADPLTAQAWGQWPTWLGLLPSLHIITRSPELFLHALLTSAVDPKRSIPWILFSGARSGGVGGGGVEGNGIETQA